MSGERLGRRDFFRKATTVGAAGAAALSFEEMHLLAFQGPPQGNPFNVPRQAPPVPDVPGPMPAGKLGPLTISRLIAGHNLIGGQAHARDLIYVSQLLQRYFTDDRILATYAMYEEKGISAAFLRIETRMLSLAKRHKEAGGKIQYIGQLVINEKDQMRDLDLACEAGARAAYIRGLEGDKFFKAGRMDLLASTIEKMKSRGLVAGLASHTLDTMIAAEKANVGADFYVKTFNSATYWSAGAELKPDPNWKPTAQQLVQSEFNGETHDNLWETTPRQTREFFHKIDKPWIAYKVLAAGAIHPRDGFEYAFASGADFISVGMYDFQIADDVNITKTLLAPGKIQRARPWRA